MRDIHVTCEPAVAQWPALDRCPPATAATGHRMRNVRLGVFSPP
jgi:hypothetical protein